MRVNNNLFIVIQSDPFDLWTERKALLSQPLQIISRELAPNYHLSRDPAEYQTDTLNATVAQEPAGRDVKPRRIGALCDHGISG